MFKFLTDSAEAVTEAAAEETADTVQALTWKDVLTNIVNWCKTSGLKVLIAIVVLIVCFLIVNGIAKAIRSGMRKAKRDEAICNAVYMVVRKGLKFLLLLIFFGYLGIDTTGVFTIISSCAVALGLALQGSLSNLAGWLIILIVKPFKLGDYISAQGQEGTVEDISIFYTHLATVDNKVVLLPNGSLANGVIVNYSRKDIRRVDLNFAISYQDDAAKAMEAMLKTISDYPLSLKTPEPFVRVTGYEGTSIKITARIWVNAADYWTVNFDLLASLRQTLVDCGCSIPAQHLDVTVDNKESK